jgi:hypothetical protein
MHLWNILFLDNTWNVLEKLPKEGFNGTYTQPKRYVDIARHICWIICRKDSLRRNYTVYPLLGTSITGPI